MENTVVINGVERKLTKRGKIVFRTAEILTACFAGGFFGYLVFMACFG